ncbi:hypothetical protein RhiirA4_460217 [Rhizophagus irregularis]|uniref:Uncharacterized protein n=1 Tax=Rhizophagus irregularis TaxID=588596 RepID=A0A2I1GG44_9GLOM|nr:hypothetical protein RhiirA4_460217 [Rhizophagus irregularis]
MRKNLLSLLGIFFVKYNYCKKFWTHNHLYQLKKHLANNNKKSLELKIIKKEKFR